MKKVKLKALEAGAKELLSREQLKNVFGGSGSANCVSTVCQAYDASQNFEWFGSCAAASYLDQGLCSCNGAQYDPSSPVIIDSCQHQ